MKKKVLACTLAAVLSVSMLAGCGNDGNSGSSSDAGSGSTQRGGRRKHRQRRQHRSDRCGPEGMVPSESG